MKRTSTAFLRNIPLFTGLDEGQLDKITHIIVERIVESETPIIHDGEKGEELFILLDGEVEVSKTLLLKVGGRGLHQRDKSLLRLRGSDYAFFGEMAIFTDDAERSASVTAKSRCVVAVISRDRFFALAETDPGIGYHVLKNLIGILSRRLDKTTQDVLKLTTALSLALER